MVVIDHMVGIVVVFSSDTHISGDVRIDDHAVIAPGVVILAAPNCSVVIASGACLGMGCIVQADQGDIEIHQGAMIGAGVLIIGSASIGENSCVGYGSTLMKTVVAAGAVLPPNSLIGDTSRKVDSENPEPTPQTSEQTKPAQNEASDPWASEVKSTHSVPKSSKSENIAEKAASSTDFSVKSEVRKTDTSEVTGVVPEPVVEKQNDSPKEPVVGQVYINQLLMTLFPHNRPINGSE